MKLALEDFKAAALELPEDLQDDLIGSLFGARFDKPAKTVQLVAPRILPAAPKIGGVQTLPASLRTVELTADEKKMCRMLGLSEEEFRADGLSADPPAKKLDTPDVAERHLAPGVKDLSEEEAVARACGLSLAEMRA